MTNVLVADGEESICTLFAALLSQYGCYHVVTTTDGRQVMDILRRESFDVVLLDMSMPGMAGLTVLRQIAQAFEDLAVIIVIGHWRICGGVRPRAATSLSGSSVPKPGDGNSSTRANNEAAHRPKTAPRSWRVVSSPGQGHVVLRPCVMMRPKRSSSGCGAR